MMTEDEARKKWCPAARVKDIECASNRGATKPHIRENSYCIASECMAWRWQNDWKRQVDNGDGTSTIEWGKNAKTYGYCGLAGNP